MKSLRKTDWKRPTSW